jgi:polyhydroxybutyrate depolymerase
MFMKRGEVLSSMASARFFADLNGAVAEPETESRALSGSIRVDRASWVAAGAEIELVAIHGAGHVIPQPAYRYPRLLGPTPRTLNGPEMVWQFFARQPPRSQ